MEWLLDHAAIMETVESVWAMLDADNLLSIFVTILCALLIWMIVKGMLKKKNA
jgi:hypothetical protein